MTKPIEIKIDLRGLAEDAGFEGDDAFLASVRRDVEDLLKERAVEILEERYPEWQYEHKESARDEYYDRREHMLRDEGEL